MFRQLNQALRRKDHYIHDAVVAGIATIDTITMHHAGRGGDSRWKVRGARALWFHGGLLSIYNHKSAAEVNQENKNLIPTI
jgi:hypothetical protein